MNEVGLKTMMPSGGLYCFTCIESMSMTSLSFAEKLLKDAQVLLFLVGFLEMVVKATLEHALLLILTI